MRLRGCQDALQQMQLESLSSADPSTTAGHDIVETWVLCMVEQRIVLSRVLPGRWTGL